MSNKMFWCRKTCKDEGQKEPRDGSVMNVAAMTSSLKQEGIPLGAVCCVHTGV